MGELGALFNPGMRHELEERRAKAARREEEGNARDGDLRIDLESGVAVINIPGAEQEDAEAAADDGESATATADDASSDSSTADADATTDSAAEAAPAPLRPRGKRGMTTSSR